MLGGLKDILDVMLVLALFGRGQQKRCAMDPRKPLNCWKKLDKGAKARTASYMNMPC